ncbi:hypothetical protein Tco_1533941 [Tanacetum coccineum]
MMVQAQDEMGEDNVADEAVYEDMDDSLERAATTATSLDAEQDRGNINKTQSKATLNEPSSLGTSSGSGPRRQETIGDTISQTGFENVSKTFNDPLLARVIGREKTKTSQAQEITSLKRRVKRLEKKRGSRTHRIKRLYKVGLSRRVESSKDKGLGEEDASKQRRINDIDANEDIYLVNVNRDEGMFGVNDLKAQALAALKGAKPKANKVMLQELEHGTITTTTTATTVTAASTIPKAKGLVIHEQDKGKGKMVEPEPVKKLSKKDQLMLDEKLAFKYKLKKKKKKKKGLPDKKLNKLKKPTLFHGIMCKQ